MMGALYEDVENFFGNMFAFHGKIVAKYPLVFIIVPIVTCGLLGLGLFNLQYDINLENLYTPIDSLAWKDQAHLLHLFPDHMDEDFYSHQQVIHPTFGEVIIRPKGQGKSDVLSPDVRNEILQLYSMITNISVLWKGKWHGYQEVCSRRNSQCVLDGRDALTNRGIKINDTVPEFPGSVALGDILSGIDDNGHCISATSLKLRFNLAQSNSEQRFLSAMWENPDVQKCISEMTE